MKSLRNELLRDLCVLCVLSRSSTPPAPATRPEFRDNSVTGEKGAIPPSGPP